MRETPRGLIAAALNFSNIPGGNFRQFGPSKLDRSDVLSIIVTDNLQDRLQTALGDGYQIERELGGAGMSRVFTAMETALQRRVVIKVLPPDLAAGVNHERFRREIQLAAGLQHPYIVPLLAAGESGGLLWFTMPFIEGESLRAAILRRGRFPARDVVRVMHDVSDALAYAHARGVVHRDIKPGNILTSGMHSLVTDFGVAKALSAATPSVAVGTTTGMAIGTPAYMAPEQLAADPAADHRMDIYAVGLLGYELLTGKSPFGGNSPQATLAAQLTQTPESPHRSMSDVPLGLSNIIMQCLEKDANKRPPSATALLAELDALPAFGSGEVQAKTMRRRRRPIIALAAILLLGVTFAAAERGRFGIGNSKSASPSKKADGAGARPRGTGSGTAAVAGAGGKSGDTAVAGVNSTVDAAVRPGTVVVYRDTSLSNDGQIRTTLPLVISRAESVAIANKFRERRAAEMPTAPAAPPQPATKTGEPNRVLVLKDHAPDLAPIATESLVVELRRVFSDSMKAAIAQMQVQFARSPLSSRTQPAMQGFEMYTPIVAPPTDGKARIVVQPYTNGTGKREMGMLGRTIADSLRAGLGARGVVSVVDEETTGRAGRGAANFMAVGWMLRADYVVTGTYFLRGDSVVVLTQFNDVRRGRFSRANETSAVSSDVLRALPLAVTHINSWIDSSSVMRDQRDRDGRGGRGGPNLSNDARRPPLPPG